MKPTSQTQNPAALSESASSFPQKTSPSASDAHPHLLFLKTGGGSTVAQPKHQLTPQQLQMLADGTGTLEGVAVGPYSPLVVSTKPVNTQSGQEGTGLQGSSLRLQHQGPLGTATVMLEGEDDSHQLASLFTPRHDQAVQTLDHTAGDKRAVQGLFSSTYQQEQMPVGKVLLRPSAKSLQGVYLDQPEVNKELEFSALEAAAARRREVFANPDSLRWLDEVTADRAERVAQHLRDLQQQEKAVTQGDLQLHRERETLNGQLLMSKGSLLAAERQPADGQRPILSRAVLLTLVLSIATNNREVIACAAIWNICSVAKFVGMAPTHALQCPALHSNPLDTPAPSPPAAAWRKRTSSILSNTAM